MMHAKFRRMFALLLTLALLLTALPAFAAKDANFAKVFGTWQTTDGSSKLLLAINGNAALHHNGEVAIYTWTIDGKDVRLLQKAKLTNAVYNGFTLKVLLHEETLVMKRITHEAEVDLTSATVPLLPPYTRYSYPDSMMGGPGFPMMLESGKDILRDLAPGLSIELSYVSNDNSLYLVLPDAETGSITISDKALYRDCKMYVSYETIAGLLGEDKSAWGNRLQCDAGSAWVVSGVRVVDTAQAENDPAWDPFVDLWAAPNGATLALNEEGFALLFTGSQVIRFNWTHGVANITLTQSGIDVEGAYDAATDTIHITVLNVPYVFSRAE